jgi:hypothetical protein
MRAEWIGDAVTPRLVVHVVYAARVEGGHDTPAGRSEPDDRGAEPVTVVRA